MKTAIGCDHAAPEMKNEIIKHLEAKGIEVNDCGIAVGEKCDYPLMGEKVGKIVAAGLADYGILICGTGIGISIAANKVHGIRAAVVSEEKSAMLSRFHNNANIIAFGARIITLEQAKKIVDVFLETPFENEERHIRRINLINKIEQSQ